LSRIRAFRREVSEAGILIEAVAKEHGTLSDYMINGNLCTVVDHILGARAVIANNLR